MARIAVFNQKGGVGKTTTSLNLSAALTRRGRPPLAIDLDPQSHLSAITGNSVHSADDSILSFFQDARPLAALVREGPCGWAVIPAHVELSKVDAQQGRGPGVLGRLGAGIARENLNTDRAVVIDCCPILGVLSLSALFASDRVLVPVSADWLAVKGVIQADRTLRALEEHVFKRKLMRRLVITRFDGRRRMAHEIVAHLTELFGDEVCRTRISESVSVAESPALNADVFSHAPHSRGAQDYDALLDELMETGFLD
ncbi:MAG: ParA family protein [Burkholderiales bacterium]|nr:ParA family protein [Burkholderiales bacterium]